MSFYKDCYQYLCSNIPMDLDGSVLEIGSGAGFLKDLLPGLITSEILDVSTVDIVLDAQTLPLKPSSLRAIVMVDVFHHLPRVKSFLKDASRCVRPGGKVIMEWKEIVLTTILISDVNKPLEPVKSPDL